MITTLFGETHAFAKSIGELWRELRGRAGRGRVFLFLRWLGRRRLGRLLRSFSVHRRRCGAGTGRETTRAGDAFALRFHSQWRSIFQTIYATHVGNVIAVNRLH